MLSVYEDTIELRVILRQLVNRVIEQHIHDFIFVRDASKVTIRDRAKIC